MTNIARAFILTVALFASPAFAGQNLATTDIGIEANAPIDYFGDDVYPGYDSGYDKGEYDSETYASCTIAEQDLSASGEWNDFNPICND